MKKNQVTFGMMNHPVLSVISEIKRAKRLGFDFLDLTLEPPEAGHEKFNIGKVKQALLENGLGVVGHTGWHLNAEAAYPEVRRGVGDALIWSAEQFAGLGAKYFTYHIRGYAARYIGIEHSIKSQIEVLRRVSERAGELGLKLIIEHNSAYDEQFRILDEFFDKIPSLGFHLDAGHANLSPDGKNKTKEFLKRYGSRLIHVHFSDNKGSDDDHLPLGAGIINWKEVVREIKNVDYRGTVTLEVFTEDEDYINISLSKVRKWFGQK